MESDDAGRADAKLEPPPVMRSWAHIYALLATALLVLILTFFFLSRHYTP